MEARRQAELEEEFKPLRREWCLGSESFRAEMLRYVEAQRGRWHYGPELGESSQAKAERLIREGLQTDETTESQVLSWRKGHPFKVRLAAQLRAEIPVTLDWMAQQLSMGTPGPLAQLLFHPSAQTQDDAPNHSLLPM